ALSVDLNPLRGWLVVQRDYLSEGPAYSAFGFETHPDYKTTAGFLASNASAEDLVIVLDSREYYNYLGRTDYWVRSAIYETQSYRRGGRLRDLYVATPLIMSAAELEELLEQPGRTKWLAASDSMLRTTAAVNDEIKSFIASRRDHVVYVARDGHTKVYRFD